MRGRAFSRLRSDRLLLAAIAVIGIALAIRVIVAFAAFDLPLSFDARDYDRHARSIAAGDGYPVANAPGGGPTAFRPPAYPYLLAAVYAISPGEVGAGRLLQALLGTLVVALLGLIAYQLWGRRVALASLAIAAVYPPLIIGGVSLFSEPLFIVFVLAAVAAALRFRASEQLGWVVAAGALAGFAMLTRPNGFALLPIALLVWNRRPLFAWRSMLPSALLLVTMVVVLIPWTVRNAIEMDVFVPVSSQAGYTLAGTYNDTARTDPEFPATWRPTHLDPEYAQLIIRGNPEELEMNRRLMSAARRYILDHPGYVLKVGALNTWRMLHLDGKSFNEMQIRGETGVGAFPAKSAAWSLWAVIALAVVGTIASRRRLGPPSLWLIPALLWTVVFIEAGNRFRLPVDPFLILLAAIGVVVIGRQLTERRYESGIRGNEHSR